MGCFCTFTEYSTVQYTYVLDLDPDPTFIKRIRIRITVYFILNAFLNLNPNIRGIGEKSPTFVQNNFTP